MKLSFRKLIVALSFLLLLYPLLARNDSQVIIDSSAGISIREVSASHPRIWINSDNLQKLRKETLSPSGGKHILWETFLNAIPSTWSDKEVLAGQAFIYLILKDSNPITAQAYIDAAIHYALNSMSIGGSRESKRDNLLRLALLYDWAYGAIALKDRTVMIQKIKTIADACINYTEDFGPFHNYRFGALSSVGIAGMVLRGDDPRAQYYIDWAADRYPDMIKVLNHFKDGGWHEGFNYAWESPGVAIRYLEAIRTATGYDPFQDTDFYKFHGYWYLYGLKPNNTWCQGFDGGYPTVLDFQIPWFAFMASKYQDPYIQWLYKNKIADHVDNPYGSIPMLRRRSIYSVGDLIWYDPYLHEHPPTNLPLGKFFSGLGMVLARSDWTDDATWISIRAQDYYGGHAHYDEGSFSIYRKGSLAIDSGIYDPQSNPHFWGYYKRTISHNALLIYDPDEPTVLWRYVPEQDYPDGGQRIPSQSNPASFAEWEKNVNSDDYSYKAHYEKGKRHARTTSFHTSNWLAYKNNNEYLYAKVDITKAYDSYKVNNVLREFVFLRPDYIIIFDRISSKKSSYTKKWLLHSIEVPRINKNGSLMIPEAGITNYEEAKNILVQNAQGRLHIKTLLPVNNTTTVIGGEGYEFFYGGVNHIPKRSQLNSGEEPGAWRVEVSPSSNQLEGHFLHFLCTRDIDASAIPNSQFIQADTMKGVLLHTPENHEVVMFSDNYDGIPVHSVCYRIAHDFSSMGGHFLINFAPGNYEVYKDGRKILSQIRVNAGEEILAFKTRGSGMFQIIKCSSVGIKKEKNN